MYSHLSKKEKLKRLVHARKRGILYSLQQHTLAALKKSTFKKPPQPTSTFSNKSNREALPSSTNIFYASIPLSKNNTNSIQAIQQTLLDLQGQ